MATLPQIHTYAIGNPNLQVRFQAARLQAAWNVLAEATTITNHAARLVWAKKVFANYGAGDLEMEYLWFLSHTLVQTKGETMTDTEVVTAAGSFVDSWST